MFHFLLFFGVFILFVILYSYFCNLVDRFKARLRSSMPRSSLVKFDRLLINSWWTTNSVWKINQCLNTQSWLLMLQKNLGLINRRSWRPLLHVPKKIVQSNSGTFLLCKILVIWNIISFSSWNILVDNEIHSIFA